MIDLRDYQKESISLLRNSFKKHKRLVLALPTGAGKTVVFSEMVRLAFEKKTRTLILTDRTELFKQTIKSLNFFGVTVEEIAPNKKHIDSKATIFLGMVETTKRRLESLISIVNPKLIIIDESHKGNFTKLIQTFPDSRVIGATASPIGKHFYQYYDDIVQNIDVPDLVEQGFLVDCKAYEMQDDFSDLTINRGEFTDHSLMHHFDKPKLYGGVIEEWNKKAKGLKTLCFNVNIKHTEEMHKSFLEAGISSEIITSKTSDEDRNRILDHFHKGMFTVLNNCGVLTTGYDESTVQCIIVNRATQSLALFLQMFGRGSRPYEGCINGINTIEGRLKAIENSKKPFFIGLDFGMNHTRFGMWNEYRKWELKPPKKKKEAVAPIKICGNNECGCMVHASVMTCPFCGYVFPKKSDSLSTGVMVEVTPKIPDKFIGKSFSSLSIDELIELEQTKKYKPTYIWRIIRSRGEESIISYAHKKGYKQGWIKRQIDDMGNSNYKDYKIIT